MTKYNVKCRFCPGNVLLQVSLYSQWRHIVLGLGNIVVQLLPLGVTSIDDALCNVRVYTYCLVCTI